jgi:glycine cleavage system H protein
MVRVPDDLHFTPQHEYVRQTKDDHIVEVGITDYAQGELGDVVFVELPKVGDRFERMQVFGTIEAVKAVSELYTPLSGEVVDVNATLDTTPAYVNSDPYGQGWMIKLRVTDVKEMSQLLDAAGYRALIGK